MLFRELSVISRAAVVGLLACAAAGVRAETITESNVVFSGNAQNFGITLNTGGDGHATVQGNGTATVWVPLVLGTGFHQDADFDVPSQTVAANIVGGSKNFTSHPAGTMTIGTSSATSAVKTFNNADVNLQNGANWGIQVTPIHVSIQLETEIVFIPIRFTVDLEINLSANLINFHFDDTAPGEVSGGFFGIPGFYRGGLNAVVRAVMHDVPIVGDYDLGEVTSFNEPDLLNQDLPLFGTVAQNDLEPRRDTFPHDLTVDLGTNLSGFALDFPIDVADVINENLPVGDGESGIKRVTLNYAVELNVQLAGLSYNLNTFMRNGLGQPDAGNFRPFYRNWDAARDFNFDSRYHYAWYTGRDEAWGYGYGAGDLPDFSPFNLRDDNWALGPENPAWVFNEDLAEPQPGYAKIQGSTNLGLMHGDLVHYTLNGPPSMLQWHAPAGVSVVNVLGMAWDPTPGSNNPVSLTYRLMNPDQTVKQILAQRTVNNSKTVIAPDYFQITGLAVNEDELIEVIIDDHSSPDFLGLNLYVEEPFAGGAARARGDFDNSGCTDVGDFLFLLDNWQLDGGSYTPPIDIGDFLALLDNWNTGATCGN